MHRIVLPGPWPSLASSTRPSSRDWHHAQAVGPGPWQPGTRLRETRSVWYRIELPWDTQLDPAARTTILTIPSFFATAEVYLGDELVAASDLPYLPLQVDMSPMLTTHPPSELLIRIGACFPDDAEFAETLHGKQDWYTPATGIFGPLLLTQSSVALPAPHWTSVLYDPTEGALLAPELVAFTGQTSGWLETPEGDIQPVQLRADRDGVRIRDPQLWSPDTPRLYTMHLVVEQGGAREVISQRFGLRDIRAEDGQILLNGTPLYLRGALDQDYWPQSLVMAPSSDALHAEIALAQRLGLNLLRCHIKPPDPRYLDAADALGMLVWEEIPSFGRLTERSKGRVRRALEALIARDGLHPSFAILTIVNEDWGPNIGGDESARRWLREEYRHTKALVGNRLVVDNSPCFGAPGSMPLDNFHVQTDLEDFHRYFLIPDAAAAWRRWVAEFAGRPAYTFSPTAEAIRTGHEPLVISEFGQWGLPNERTYLSAVGDEPEWFRTDNGHLQGMVSAAGVRERFARLGLDRIFGSYEEMTLATQRHQAAGLAQAIGEIRLHPSIRGYVLTEWTDVEWEANGLLDMTRRLKPGVASIAEALKDDLLILRPAKAVYTPGERVRIDVATAWVQSKRPLAEVRWRCSWGAGGTLAPRQETAGLTLWESAEMTLPPHDVPEPSVEFLWLDGQARVVDNQGLRVPVVRLLPSDGRPTAQLWGAAQALESVIVPAAASDTSAPVIVTGFSSAALDALRENRQVLVLAGDGDVADIPSELAYLRPVPRAGSRYEANWITAWHYIDPRWLRVENPLGMMFEDVLPMRLIPWHERIHAVDVLSGVFVGWVDLPAVSTYQHGGLTVTTFPLLRGIQTGNPLAIHLLYALLDRAAATAERARGHTPLAYGEAPQE
jgi:hypothetical protein